MQGYAKLWLVFYSYSTESREEDGGKVQASHEKCEHCVFVSCLARLAGTSVELIADWGKERLR